MITPHILKILKVIFYIVFCIHTSVISVVSQTFSGTKKIIGAPQIYNRPVMGAMDETNLEIIPGSRWEVYSDRSDNVLYSDNQGRYVKGITNFMESFYVTNEAGEYLNVFFDPTPDKGGMISPNGYEKGWIKKSTLLLWRNCLIEPSTNRQIQVMTFESQDFFTTNDSVSDRQNGIVIYDDPFLKDKTAWKTEAKQFYFIFKKEGTSLLIGTKKRIMSDNDPKNIILGWVPEDYCYYLTSRLWITPNTSQEAEDERKITNVFPVLFNDKNQALNFRSNTNYDQNNKIWQWNQTESLSEWPCFPLVNVDNDIAKVKIVDEDFKTAYAPLRIDGLNNSLFLVTTLIDYPELGSVISSMKYLLEKAAITQDQTELLKTLIAIYRKEYGEVNENIILNLSFRQFFESFFWITTSQDQIMQLALRKLNDPTVINDDMIDKMVQRLKYCEENLDKLANSRSFSNTLSFTSNNTRYFWIDLSFFY
jgi:hypothetical protein